MKKFKMLVISGVGLVSMVAGNIALAADPIKVDLPDVDTATVLAWLAGFIVVSITIAAMYMARNNGKSMLKGS